MKPNIKDIQIDIYFHLPSTLMLKNPIFFKQILNSLSRTFYFLSFMNTFSKSNQTAISQWCEPH